jgi:pyruvate formate lyase activating enzyme
VTLVVPGLNDSRAELEAAAGFIAGVSRDIPWHVTAFHPDYRMHDTAATAAARLVEACEIGRAAGLRYVYAGNLPGRVGPWENTYCPSCEAPVVERVGYAIRDVRLDSEGACRACGTRVPGIWN